MGKLKQGERCLECEAVLSVIEHNPESLYEWYDAGNHVCSANRLVEDGALRGTRSFCEDCGEDTTERVKLIPTAKLCVVCQEANGDVFRYRGYRGACTESGKHLGDVDQLVKSPDVVVTEGLGLDSYEEDDDG